MLAEIIRTKYRNDGTLGTLYIDDFPVCSTLELPWRNNEPQVSCIPTLQTIAKRVDSPKFGDTFEIIVPDRTHILFHGANTMKDLLGCVGLAEFFHNFDGKVGIANPYKGAAMIEFHQITKNVDQFDVHIYDIVSVRR